MIKPILGLLSAGLLAVGCTHTAATKKMYPPVPVPESISTTLAAAKPGDVVELHDFPLEVFRRIPYEKMVLPGPQYIISDDPEYIRVPEGVAVREDVEPGTVRLYVYNVNGVRDPEIPRKISAVIENLGSGDLTLKFHNYAYTAPSGNYFGVAKNALHDFLAFPTSGKSVPDVIVPAGEARPIDERMENSVAVYNDLVHGFYEFEIDQPARIYVVQTAPETPSPEAIRRLDTVLESPRRNAGRGLFPVANYAIETLPSAPIDTANGPVQIVVADGKDDPWIRGVDSSSGEELELAGNYGVLYEMALETKSSDGRGLAVVTWNYRYNPVEWCGGMALSMRVDEGLHPAGVYKMPSNRLNTTSAPEAVVIQVYPPVPEGESRTINLTYSPPGASCLPTPLVFIPIDFP